MIATAVIVRDVAGSCATAGEVLSRIGRINRFLSRCVISFVSQFSSEQGPYVRCACVARRDGINGIVVRQIAF